MNQEEGDLANAYRCTHGSDAPEPLLARLPESQAGTARHKCALCAYSHGRAAGARRQHDKAQMEHCQHGNAAPAAILADLQDSQAGPGVQRHKCCICAFAQGFDATVALSEIPHADELSEPEKFHEGAVKAIAVNAYERNSVARQRCIEHYGDKCSACGFHFESRYGPAGKGLIHVHHLFPLGSIGADYEVDPIRHLRPVCPNCRAMLHRQDPPYSIDELSAMLNPA